MTTNEAVNDFHKQAMDFADLAVFARRRRNTEEALGYFRQAYELESKAANELLDQVSDEPSRSVLFRSAASLALECGETREAERLVSIALIGNPPEEIAQELRALFEQIHFTRHLDSDDITLSSGEIELSVIGSAIGYGMALADVVIDRISDLDKLIRRTVERRGKKPFQERGPARKSIDLAYRLFMSTPRAGSFALTLKLGQQAMLPGLDNTEEIVNEVVECLDLINKQLYDDLEHRIEDPAYRRHFIHLAKKIAPDGDKVSMVGLTHWFQGEPRQINFSTQAGDIRSVPTEELKEDESSESVSIVGTLKFANSLKKSNEIRLLDNSGVSHKVAVPAGLMSDIVKPLWEETVVVRGVKTKKGTIILHDIEAYD